MGRVDLVGRSDDERGFTLIELLVVIVIIGILAGIAIGAFLSQRSKGYDAAAKSDLRNLAAFEEIYLNDYGVYGKLSQVRASEPDVKASHRVNLSVFRYDGLRGFCLRASSLDSPNTWWYDSQAGGLQPEGSGGCPTTTGGLPGDGVIG